MSSIGRLEGLRCRRISNLLWQQMSMSSSAIHIALGNGALTRTPIDLSDKYPPKGIYLSVYSQAKLNRITRVLNERPRKTLDYEIPAERFG